MSGSKLREQLGVTVGKVLSLREGLTMFEEDIRLFHAPRECYRQVYASYHRRYATILFEAGFKTGREFFEAVRTRTTAHWAHVNDLVEAIDPEIGETLRTLQEIAACS